MIFQRHCIYSLLIMQIVGSNKIYYTLLNLQKEGEYGANNYEFN